MSIKENFSFIKGYPVEDNKLADKLDSGEPQTGLYMGWNDGDMGIEYGWCNNFRGFIPYRYLVENE